MSEDDTSGLPQRAHGALRSGMRYAARRAGSALGEMRAAFRHKRYACKYGSSAPEPYRLIHVDPSNIEYLLADRFDARISDHGTHILGSNWDQTTSSKGLMYANIYEEVFTEPTLVPFDRFGFYTSAKERFEEGVPWTSTAFYQWCLERIESDAKRSPRFDSREDLMERLELFDSLYTEIRSNGYRTQRELQASRDVAYHKTVWPPERHEVKVSIGRDGEIFFDEGQHRFVIAKVLGLPGIPVRVFVRHRRWQEKRAIVSAQKDPSSTPLDLPVDLNHPDLTDVLGNEGPPEQEAEG